MARFADLPSLGINTSEEFIQKLKGAQDPIPVDPTGPSSSSSPSSISKIELAHLAWALSRSGQQQVTPVHIPQLPSVLLGWLLDTLSTAAKPTNKAKAATSVSLQTPLRDPAFYSLLDSLTSEADLSVLARNSLSSIAPRSTPQSILSIAAALFKTDEAALFEACLPVAAKPLSRLLAPLMPGLLSSQGTRHGIDETLQIICAKIGKTDHVSEEADAVLQATARLVQTICIPVVEASAEGASSFSSKSQQYFLQHSLLPWAQALDRLSTFSDQWGDLHRASARAVSSLRKNLYAHGQSVLFSSLSTRQLLFPSSGEASNTASMSLIAALRQDLEAGSDALFTTLPVLVRSAIRALQVHSDDLASVARAHHKRRATAASSDLPAPEAPGHEYLDREEIRQTLEVALFEQFIGPALDLVKSPKLTSARHAAQSLSLILHVILDTKFGTTLSGTGPWTSRLTATAQTIVSEVASGEDSRTLTDCLSAMHALWNIDQNIARRHLEALIGSLCARTPMAEVDPELTTSFQAFLDDVLTSFARSQEIPSFVALLSQQVASINARPWHQLFGLSSQQFAGALAASVGAYVSPTQVVPLLTDVAARFENLFAPLRSDAAPLNEQGGKRKSGQDVVEQSHIQLSNALQLVHPVLSALNIPAAISSEALAPIVRIQALLREAISVKMNATSTASVTSRPAKKPRKSNGQQPAEHEDKSLQSLNTQSLQLVASSLWCWYGLCAALKRLDQKSGSDSLEQVKNSLEELDSCWTLLLTFLSNSHDQTLSEEKGELMLEVVRLLFYRKEVETESRSVFEPTGAPDTTATFWSIVLAVLRGKGAESTQTALWEMLSRRWLLVASVSPPHPKFLAEVSMLLLETLPPSAKQSSRLHESSVAVSRNADFLELKEWRAELMSRVGALTSGDVPSRDALGVFAALAAFPEQYVSGEFKEVLVQRAISSASAVADDKKSVEDLAAVRRWLAQIAKASVMLTSSMADTVLRACHSLGKPSSENLSLEEANEELMQIWLIRLIECQHLDESQLQALVKDLEKSRFANILLETFIGSDRKAAANVRFTLNDAKLLSSDPFKVWSTPASTFKGVRLALSLARIRNGEDGGQVRQTLEWAVKLFDVEDIWSTESALLDDSLSSEYLALAAICFEAGDGGRSSDLGRRVFQGLARGFADRDGGHGGAEVEQAFHRASGSLSVEEYENTLKSLIKDVEAQKPSEGAHTTALLKTLGLLLKHGPEGTLLVAQKQFTRLLSRLQHLVSQGETQVILGALQAVETICNGRSIIVRPTDAGLLLALLSNTVSRKNYASTRRFTERGSLVADARAIFSSVVGTIGTLIRLRKELLLPILPHVAIVLSQLPALFRKPAPGLIGTHKSRVLETMPDWLADAWSTGEGDEADFAGEAEGDTDTPQEVLGESHAREFSRLLESITAKTTSGRSRREVAASGGHGANASKVDSLSRPFSKHAVYVILAYIHALLDGSSGDSGMGEAAGTSASYLDRRVKRELLVGLCNLCGIIDESERDWVLVSDLLDEAGKSVFKEIWRAWERGRYKGV